MTISINNDQLLGIGLPVVGGTANHVLYIDSNGLLAGDSDFTFIPDALTTGTLTATGSGRSSFTEGIIVNEGGSDSDTRFEGSGEPNFVVFDAGTLTVTITGGLVTAGHILPSADDTYSLGSATKQWDNLYIDGIAYVDYLSVDSINGANFIVQGDTIAVGPLAGTTLSGDEDECTLFGYRAGTSLNTGDNNTFIGFEAGRYTTGGASNTFVGNECGEGNIGGDQNTGIGKDCLKDLTYGLVNTGVGFEAGEGLTTGDYNVLLGGHAGENMTTANYNTVVGYNAGENLTGSDNVFLGHGAGGNLGAVSDTLVIANSNTATPLIKGVFPNTSLTLDASTQIGTATTDIHGINLAPAANRGVNSMFTSSLTSGSWYGHYTTLSQQAKMAGYSQLYSYGNYVDFDSSQTKAHGFDFSAYWNVGTMNDNTDSSVLSGIIATYQIGTWNKVHFGGTYQDNLPGQLMYGSYNILTGDLKVAGDNIETSTKYGTYNIVSGEGKLNYGGYFSATEADTNWAVYAVAGENYFAENVGIGIAPGALLHVNAAGVSSTFFTSTGASSFVTNKYQCGTSTGYVYQFGQSYSPGSARWMANSMVFDAASAGGLNLSAYSGSGHVRIYTAGDNLRMDVDENGMIGMGIVPEANHALKIQGGSDDGITLLQGDDSKGAIIYGYDDKSSDYYSMYILSNGQARMASSGIMKFKNDTSGYIWFDSYSDCIFELGDNAGVDDFTIKDSDQNPVMNVDSDGTMDLYQGLNLSQVERPPAFTATLVEVAGNNDIGDGYYYISYITALGETELTGLNGSSTTGGQLGEKVISTAGKQQADIVVTASTDYRVTGINIYRSGTANHYNDVRLVDEVANADATIRINLADANKTGPTNSYVRSNTTNSYITLNDTQVMAIGEQNTFFGLEAGAGTTTAATNVFVGYQAGKGTATHSQSVAVGSQAAASGSGLSASVTVGYDSCRTITGNSPYTTAVGHQAMRNRANGASSTGVGRACATDNDGANNCFFGYQAGRYITGGSTLNEAAANGIYIGHNSKANVSAVTNEVVIGYDATGNGTNTVTIGNSSVTDNYFNGTLHNTGGRVTGVERFTGADTLDSANHIAFCDTDGGAFTLTLPAGVAGTVYEICNCGSGGNDLTVDGDGAEEINGSTTQVLSDGESIQIIFEATEEWRIF